MHATFVFTIISLYAIPSKTILLRTRLGYIQGVRTGLFYKGNVYEFRKIPYARPPVGLMRFRKSVVYGPWRRPLDGTRFGPSCIQNQDIMNIPPAPNRDISENCLFLNIYVPYHVLPYGRRAVMVWIHGGAYQTGQGMRYDGRELALEGNVIVVTINYRLGAFGFFTTGDEISPGNYGLWDQSLALRWVHEHIDSFGGDRNSVTIFGESAGGDSVTFQSLFPGNKGFFQRAITQSGVATNPLYFAKERRIEEEAKKFFIRIGCSYSDRIAAINCARTVPASVILQNQPPTLSIVPIVDGEFVLGTPGQKLLDKTSEVFKFFSSLDYMAGSLDGDGSVLLGFLPASSFSMFNVRLSQGVTTDYLCGFLTGYLSDFCCPKDQHIANKICKSYTDTRSLQSQSVAISTLISDALLTFPLLFTADVHQSANFHGDSTYSFYMTRVTPIQDKIFPAWTFPWVNQTTHGMDFVYLFFASEIFRPFGLYDDIKLGLIMKKYWTNFAKYGNPNGPLLPFWPSYGMNRRTQILDLTISTVENIFPEKNRFWIDFAKTFAIENARSCFPVFRYGRRISQCVATKRRYSQKISHFT